MSLQQRINQVLERIDGIESPSVREALTYQYVTGTRISEVTGRYAISKEDFMIADYKGNQVALFSQKTAKKNGRVRIIALPTYLPRVESVIFSFERVTRGKVFDQSSRNLELYCARHFKGIGYLIEEYGNRRKDTFKEEHERQASTHALRHFRFTEMKVRYGFSETDCDIFFGWIPRGIGRRYAYELWLEWSSYIDKLLKPLDIVLSRVPTQQY